VANAEELKRMRSDLTRFLFDIEHPSDAIVMPYRVLCEGSIEEFSPSEERVKISGYWYETKLVKIIEEL
jgi:hypothetical protein